MERRTHAEMVNLLKKELKQLQSNKPVGDFEKAYDLIDDIEKSYNQVFETGSSNRNISYRSLHNNNETDKNLLAIVFDTIPGAVFWKDADFRFKYVNQKFLEVVGYKYLSDVEGKTDFELKWLKDESEHFRVGDLKIAESQKPLLGIKEKLTTAEGKTIWLKSHKAPIITENGKFEGIIGVIEDISERQATRIALRHSEARLKSYFNNVTDGIFVLDEGFTIQNVNPATFDITGLTPEELKDKRIFDLFTNDESLMKVKANCFGMDIEPVSGECSMIVNDRELKYLKIDVVKIEIDHYICILKDVSELTRAIKKAQESNKLKTAFLQNISHEIRTPLNAIIGFSNILIRNMYESEEDAIRYKKIIYANSEYLLGLVNSVIDLSKIEAGQTNLNPEEIVLVPFLHNEVLPIIESERNRLEKSEIQIHIDTSKLYENLSMYVDANRLKQIIVNLMHNALKFTMDGSVSLIVEQKNDHLKFEVVDSGIGINKDQLNRIFHRFYKIFNSQQVSMGSGLGLAIVKKLLDLMNGDISVSSVEGKGSTFTFVLPIVGD